MAAKEFTFKNLEQWQRKLRDPRLFGDPLRKALLRSVEFAKGQAQERTPVDRGRARNSYSTEVDSSPIPKWAKVGSNLEYIEALEKGTKPHWPPFSALQPWARRHGFPAGNVGAFLVARAISQRGTKAHHMMEEGIAATKPFFKKQLIVAGKTIEKRWKRLA